MLERELALIGGDEGEALFAKVFGAEARLGLFLRRLVGLDREAAMHAFGTFLEGSTYNSNQIAFIGQVIDYLTQNGVMDLGILFEQPFTNLDPSGIEGMFGDEDCKTILRIVSDINMSAEIKLTTSGQA